MNSPRRGDDTRLEGLLAASLLMECPPADELADVILGVADSAVQLRVAAHMRTCPACQELAEACRPPELRVPLRTRLARLVTAPALAEGRRGDASRGSVRQYVHADLTIDLTLTTLPDEMVRLTGQVLRAGQALPNCRVVVRRGRRRPLFQQTDTAGVFGFAALDPGSYSLTVEDGPVAVRISPLELGA